MYIPDNSIKQNMSNYIRPSHSTHFCRITSRSVDRTDVEKKVVPVFF